jgi:hypothetical protein
LPPVGVLGKENFIIYDIMGLVRTYKNMVQLLKSSQKGSGGKEDDLKLIDVLVLEDEDVILDVPDFAEMTVWIHSHILW